MAHHRQRRGRVLLESLLPAGEAPGRYYREQGLQHRQVATPAPCARGNTRTARSDRTLSRPAAEFDAQHYRRRNVIERCVGWLKEARDVAAGFENLAVHYPGMIRRCLRAALSNAA